MTRLTSYQSGCFGWGCPLKYNCARWSHHGKAMPINAPWMKSDYMLIEQGYDPAYCEFYIYNKDTKESND